MRECVKQLIFKLNSLAPYELLSNIYIDVKTCADMRKM